MGGFELVLGYLGAWALRKAGRVGRRLDGQIDQALDAALDRLEGLVRSKLGPDPSLWQFTQEAARGDQSQRTRQRVTLALEEAADTDPQFAGALQRAVTELQRLDRRGDVLVAAQPVGRDQISTATSGGVAGGIINGPVTTSSTSNVSSTINQVAALESSIPGQVMIVVGSALAFVAFAGWASIIFRAWGSNGNTGFGPNMPSGIPLAALYFVAFAAGGVIAGVGQHMKRTARDKRYGAAIGQILLLCVVIFAAVGAVNYSKGSAPYSDLVPRFASCPGSSQASPDPNGGPNFIPLAQWTCASK